MDDAHSLLARVEPGMAFASWATVCHGDLRHLSLARRREIVRLLRDHVLGLDPQRRVVENLFLRFYRNAAASAQVDLLDLAWALSHPLPLLVADRILAPARASGELDIPLASVEDLVRSSLATDKAESIRKTRTVVLGALERVGAIRSRGTGKNRSIRASRGEPHPLAFGWLLYRSGRNGPHELSLDRGVTESMGTRLTGCTAEHASAAIAWCLDRGVVGRAGDMLVCDGRPISRIPRSELTGAAAGPP